MSALVEYQVHVRRDDDGSFWAEVTELPGCFASGADLDELRDNLVESIGIYLSTPESHVKMELAKIEETENVSNQQFKVLVDA